MAKVTCPHCSHDFTPPKSPARKSRPKVDISDAAVIERTARAIYVPLSRVMDRVLMRAYVKCEDCGQTIGPVSANIHGRCLTCHEKANRQRCIVCGQNDRYVDSTGVCKPCEPRFLEINQRAVEVARLNAA